MKKWINNVARVIKSPKTGSYFLAFERRKDKAGEYVGESPYPMVINEGDTFPLRLKKDDLRGLVENGTLSKEAADEICERIKFEMSIPPSDEEEKPKASGKKKPTNGEDIF